jgi:hypothetical protein
MLVLDSFDQAPSTGNGLWNADAGHGREQTIRILADLQDNDNESRVEKTGFHKPLRFIFLKPMTIKRRMGRSASRFPATEKTPKPAVMIPDEPHLQVNERKRRRY